MSGPDFSDVDTIDKALALEAEGVLERMFLVPLEFGGTEAAPNFLFVPLGIAAMKASTDFNVIAPLAEEGKVSAYSVKPEYVGRSVVPISIEIIANNPGHFVFNLAVWGEALDRE